VLGSNHAAEVLKELNAIKLTPRQQMLLSRFYDALREAKPDCRIDYATLERIAAHTAYESDLAIGIWQQLDDYLVTLRNDKLRQDLEKQKAKR